MRRDALSLVEMLLAVVVALLVVGLAVELAASVRGQSRRIDARLDARERAAQTLLMLRHTLVDASRFELTSTPGELDFETPAGHGELRFARGVLRVLWPGGRTRVALIDGGLKDFRIALVAPGTLQVTLELERPPAAGRVAGLAPLILSDEVFAPVIGLASADPWNEPAGVP